MKFKCNSKFHFSGFVPSRNTVVAELSVADGAPLFSHCLIRDRPRLAQAQLDAQNTALLVTNLLNISSMFYYSLFNNRMNPVCL